MLVVRIINMIISTLTTTIVISGLIVAELLVVFVTALALTVALHVVSVLLENLEALRVLLLTQQCQLAQHLADL